MMCRFLITCILLITSFGAFSQQKDKLEIIQGKIKLSDFEGEEQVIYLYKNKQGQAKLKQKNTFIDADEIKNVSRINYAEAYKNVYINHADSIDIYSQRAEYFGDRRLAKLKDEVVLKKDVYTIQTDELDYDLNTGIATYTKEGELSDTTSVLTSVFGKFNTKTEIAEFRENVVLRTQDRQIETEQLTYHMKDKWAYFKGATKITEKDGRVIITQDGKYNTETGEAIANTNPVIEDDKSIFKATSIQKNGDLSKATGNVYYYDKVEKYRLTADNAEQLGENHIKATGNVEYYDEMNQVKFSADKAERFEEHKAKAYGNVRYTDELKQQIFTANEAEQFSEHHFKAIGNVTFKDKLKQLRFTADEAEQFEEDKRFAKGNVFIQDDKNYLIIKANEVEQFDVDKIEMRQNVDITNTKDSINLTANKALVFKESEIFYAFDNVNVKRLNDSSKLLTDSLYFDNNKGYGEAKGRSFLETEDNGDKIYMIAETLKAIRQNNVDSTYNFLADKKVKIFKSDIQAIADSAYVNAVDSIITLTKQPVVWTDSIQMSADSIRIYLKEGEVDKVEFRKNCFFVNLVEGQLYNQMRGRKMDVHFKAGEINDLFVDGNAETIFFVQDDNKAFVGVDEMKSGQIDVQFEEGKVKEINWLKQQEGTTYPFQDIDPESRRFPNFSWRENERPTGKDYLLIASGRKEGQLPASPQRLMLTNPENVEFYEEKDLQEQLHKGEQQPLKKQTQQQLNNIGLKEKELQKGQSKNQIKGLGIKRKP